MNNWTDTSVILRIFLSKEVFMEDFNELGLMYYAAVDSRNKSLALELLAQIIAKLNEDDRIVNLFSKLEISDHEKQDVLADINSEIWSNSLSRTTKRWDSKKMTFDSWILIMGDHIARNHSIALETKKIRKKLKKRRALTNSDKLVNRNLEEIKKRESERKTKENPKFKVFGGLGKPQVNRSELLSTTETELNQSNLNKLLQDFTFIFPNSFIQKTENNPMQIWGIPIRDEDAENNGLLIVVQKLKPQFDCLRKFKAIIIAKQPSGNYKTLENNGSKTIYASELETNSVCTLTIILEKPKAVAVVDDWNSIDTSNLQIEKILRTIFGTGHNSELPKLDAPGHLTLNQPAKNQSIIFYEFSFPLAMAAAGKDDSGNDWV